MKTIAIISTATLLMLGACKSSAKKPAEDQQQSQNAVDTNKGGQTQFSPQVYNTSVGKIEIQGKEAIVNGRKTKFIANAHSASGTSIDTTPYPFYIRGKLINGRGGNITMDELGIGLSTIKPIYQQVVNKDEMFDFDGVISEPKLIQLRLPYESIHLIVRPKDTIILELKLSEPWDFKVKGSPETERLRQMYLILDKANDKKGAFQNLLDSTKDNKKYVKLIESQSAKYAAIDAEKMNDLRNFIQKNGNSYVCLMAAMYLNPDKYFDFLKALDKRMEPLYKTTVFYQAVHNKVQMFNATALNHFAPEIIIPDQSGKDIRLSSYKGKYVLVDFWASYATPRRAESANLSKLYKRYKNKGFTIFSVSLDKKKEDWLDAMNKDNMEWPNGSDLHGFESGPVSVYMVTDMPCNYLLDPEGRIIAKNLIGAALEKKLAELIK